MALKGVCVRDGIVWQVAKASKARVDMNEVDTEGRDNRGKMSRRPEWVFNHHSVHSPGFFEDFVGVWAVSFRQKDKVKGKCGHL